MMFLDESGNHDLRRIDPSYPVFVLGGIIAERSYVREVIDPVFRRFKRRHFGRDDIVLHTVDMHKGRGNYGFLTDPSCRTEFFVDLNAMLEGLEFQVIACVVKKVEHVHRYEAEAADPYHVALKYLVERFCLDLGQELDSGFICAERRNPGLDFGLLEVWEELRRAGTEHISAAEIDAKILELDLKDKRPNLSGMQLADLVITPIERHVAGKLAKPNEVRWEVVERKLRKVNGEYLGPGLIIRPR
jgi:hypothetical protein